MYDYAQKLWLRNEVLVVVVGVNKVCVGQG